MTLKGQLEKQNLNLNNISCGDASRKITSALDKGIALSWGKAPLLKVGNFKQ